MPGSVATFSVPLTGDILLFIGRTVYPNKRFANNHHHFNVQFGETRHLCWDLGSYKPNLVEW